MDNLQYTVAERISLKDHPEFNEAWLQDRIVEEPRILGLGELVVVERERRQDKAGRLDLLLADPGGDERYEVELMLGATDESHIIRCIEYWDIERRRYPQYDHCAVLVAEDITSRFLNVLSLFNGQIPMITVQMDALRVNDNIVLDFVRVMDRFALRRDDVIETTPTVTDRSYWNERASKTTVDMTDSFLEIINQKASPSQNLNYNKYYIGLHDGIRSANFVFFKPKKKFAHVFAEVKDKETWTEQFEEAGVSVSEAKRHLRLTVIPTELGEHRELLARLLHKAVEEHQGA